MEEKLGVLGTDLTTEDVTKYVVAKLMFEEDKYEIINILGNNEDYYPLGNGYREANVYSKQGINRTLTLINKNNLPVYTCEILHDSTVTTPTQTSTVFGTTEIWDLQCQPIPEEFYVTLRAFDDVNDFWCGKINAPDDVSIHEIIDTFNMAGEQMISDYDDDMGPEEMLNAFSATWEVEIKDTNHFSLAMVEAVCLYEGWQWETVEVSEIPDSGIQSGMSFKFNTEDDTDLYPRNGDTVTVLEVLNFRTAKELTLKRLEKGYIVRFEDGYETEVYQDELHAEEAAVA